MQEFGYSINALGIAGTVVVGILITWILYRGEQNSRKRGGNTASYGIIFFMIIILGHVIIAYSEMIPFFSAIEQVVYWVSVLFLSLYLILLIQDMRTTLKDYRIMRDRDLSIETEAD